MTITAESRIRSMCNSIGLPRDIRWKGLNGVAGTGSVEGLSNISDGLLFEGKSNVILQRV